MDIMDPQWPSREAERLSGSGHGRLNVIKFILSQQTNPCAPLCTRALPALCFFQSASPYPQYQYGNSSLVLPGGSI